MCIISVHEPQIRHLTTSSGPIDTTASSSQAFKISNLPTKSVEREEKHDVEKIYPAEILFGKGWVGQLAAIKVVSIPTAIYLTTQDITAVLRI